jgi:hypothetical protein
MMTSFSKYFRICTSTYKYLQQRRTTDIDIHIYVCIYINTVHTYKYVYIDTYIYERIFT